jgi:glucose/arabinose dehydrogenase
MRLGIYGWAAIVALVVLALAAWVVGRPILERGGAVGIAPAGAAALPAGGTRARVRFEPVMSGLSGPVDLQFIPGSTTQAVVLEKGGRARLVELPGAEGAGAAGVGAAPGGAPAADVVSLEVHVESELGLLGLAFHPRYLDNGLFYLNTNPRDGGPLRTRISEWHWPRAAIGREPAKQTRVLLEIEQPYKNHDGGQIAFGPDGYLYIGMGDGGSRADPEGHGQNLSSLLGKMLRIDVDGKPSYRVPSDNPFVSTPGARPEIWAYGLRNPWRFSFDPKGRLIAADVGQDQFEEVDIVSAGANLGWKVREARHCFAPAQGCATNGLVDPVFEYGREAGQSITGGYVYLGRRLPELHGKYIFGDFVTGRAWALALPDSPAEQGKAEELGVFQHAFSSFGRGPDGEVYALDFARGLILRLAPA